MKLKPFCFTPSSFVDYGREAIPELQQFTWNESFVYLSLVWGNTGGNKRYQHATNDDNFSVTAKLLTERLGRQYVDIFKAAMLIEIAGGYDMTKGQTKPYKITDKAKQLVTDYMINDQSQTELLGLDKKPYVLATKNKQPNAIKSRDKNDNNAKCRLCINPIVKIHLAELEAFKNSLIVIRDRLFHLVEPKAANDDYMKLEEAIATVPEAKLEKWLERRIVSAMQLIHMASVNSRLPSGQIIQSYIETNSGRLYGQDIHLQTLPREIKEAALSGQYDYDFENCHYAILSQIAIRYGVDTPFINDYLANKKQIRKRLASSIDVSIDKLKSCLIALIYGASIELKPKLALSDELGIEKLAKLVRNRIFNGLHKDIKAARSAVLRNYQHNCSVINEMGKRLNCKKSKSSLLAHILQGYEAKMLNIVINMYGNEITLLQHDGFTSPNPGINTHKIEAEIFKETGLKMIISKSVLKTPRMHSTHNATELAA